MRFWRSVHQWTRPVGIIPSWLHTNPKTMQWLPPNHQTIATNTLRGKQFAQMWGTQQNRSLPTSVCQLPHRISASTRHSQFTEHCNHNAQRQLFSERSEASPSRILLMWSSHSGNLWLNSTRQLPCTNICYLEIQKLHTDGEWETPGEFKQVDGRTQPWGKLATCRWSHQPDWDWGTQKLKTAPTAGHNRHHTSS